MAVQGVLYDGATGSAEIATFRLQVQRRASPPAAPAAKGGDGWRKLLLGGDAELTIRVIAEGILSQSWYATLAARWEAGTHDVYRVDFADGDSLSGPFRVEALEDVPQAEDRRLFRLLLLSAAAVAYTPA